MYILSEKPISEYLSLYSTVMNHLKYPVFTDDPHLYLFLSEGPRGKITKAVIYSQMEANLFNLGFGDRNEERRELDDSSRSNNDDRDKIWQQ